MEVNGAEQLFGLVYITHKCLVSIVLQNILLCVHQKKETHTGLQQREG